MSGFHLEDPYRNVRMLPAVEETWHRYDVESLDANVFVEPDFDTSLVSDVIDAAFLAKKGEHNPGESMGPGCFGIVSPLGGYVLKTGLAEGKYTMADALANHGLAVGLDKIHDSVFDQTGLHISAPRHHVIVAPKNYYSPKVFAATLMDIAPGEKAMDSTDIPSSDNLGRIYSRALYAAGLIARNIKLDHSPHHLFVERDAETGAPVALTKLDVQPVGNIW